MMIDLKHLDPEGSVLFLGSGFSVPSINIRNEELPSGTKLKSIFADIVGVDEHSYNFQTLADEVASQEDLYQLLYELFTVKNLSSGQLELLKFPWLRIYTTNYDNAVELGYHQLKRTCPSFNYDDNKPRKIAPGAVIHLHGSIKKATRENILDQLILNEGSYIRQHFEKSIWYDEFVRDVRFATNCFFIGYSLSDYHISALLHPVPDVREKTYFVNRSPDTIFSKRVNNYGQVVSIGLDGFVNQCISLPRLNRLQNPYALKSFRLYDPFKDKKTLSPPTPIEVLNLVTYGSFNEQRCVASLLDKTYIVPRSEHIFEASQALSSARTLLVHSRLGNGKSIFISILAYKLSEQGYRCFRCLDVSPTLSQDLEALRALDNVVLIFDSYDVAIEVISMAVGMLEFAKFVIAIRTGVQDVRLHEIQDRLPKPIDRISLNGLTDSEREDFAQLLDNAGILERSLRDELLRCDDIREIITSVYKHAGIQQKLENELRPIMADKSLRLAMVAIHLLNIAGLRPDSAFLRAISGANAYILASKFREITSEIVRFENDELHAHSSIFSEYLSENFFEGEDVIESVYAMTTESVRRKPHRLYQAVTSYFMQVSNLKRLITGANQSALLAGLFDRLHRDTNVNDEPLFWLQYSILMMDLGELPAAERFLNTAYARASALAGFKTFQLDTHALRILLILETADNNTKTVSRFDQILTQIDNVASMLNESSHRPFALRALKELEPFARNRSTVLATSECNALLIQLERLSRILQSVSTSDETYVESQEALANVENAKEVILKLAAP
ncbi:MAG: hypothetical protein E6Q59_06115 [Nitrosomonas sp.]|nr:MAG: hypothetical protein E6Q59_06115 [Nitrosomonas sp.]